MQRKAILNKIIQSKIVRNKVSFFYIILFSFITYISTAAISKATKIVAVVNNSVITDTDIEDFETVLCKLDRRFKCGSHNSRQMATMVFIESVLKLEHFRQINLINDKQFNRGFNEYKRDVLKKMNLKQSNLPKTFESYLRSEFLWNIAVSSQAQYIEISNKEIENFAKKNNLKNKSKDQIKQLIQQKKMDSISQNMLDELKKFYLIDYKNV